MSTGLADSHLAESPLVDSRLADFHPDLAQWFAARLGAPTAFQCDAWQAIRRGEDTLLAAPTGSGKTFAAFWVALDGLWRRAEACDSAGNPCGGGQDSHDLGDHTEVLYVSPLKALSNDIEKNLQRPLREMRDRVFHDRLKTIDVRVGLRTGDTSAKDRAAMNRKPPHIVVTTPESLYLLLTSKGGRHMLRHVRTVIVDEVHALLPDRRGAHLMLSLQRLEALCGHRPQRIGLSATQKPIERVAHFLVGSRRDGSQGEGSPRPCTVVDVGLRRSMDLAVVLPGSPLQAVMPLEVWEEVYAQLEAHIQAHRTTLIFVNTRRMAERVAHRLAQNLGEELVAAHHGSMSRERRLRAETALKEGRLKVMVATASLELGIDIGEVDLCIQLGTPKTIASFVQRMGRSGHFIGGTPKGRIFPLTRDELVEAAALMRCVKRGELDTLILPRQPLDILAQQIVAEVACRECGESDLYALLHEAAMYQSLSYAAYQGVVAMLSEGFTTRRGRQGAYIHRDQVHGRLRARRGARLAAITSGGAIPDTFDVEVRLEPGDLVIGSVNEDFAIESMPGDIFQLGNRSWRILRVEANALRVADAGNEPPGIPFWLGEAPGRSAEFSEALSAIREGVSLALGDITAAELSDASDSSIAPWRMPALQWLDQECDLHADAALQIIDYLASAQLALGALPTTQRLMLERFFDEGGAMHLVLHAPLGSRLNRALGLALRKRFCRKFNFELQAAATEDAIILSLGASHSFPLQEVWQYLHAESVRPILIQALLAAPMFEVRWRWNASRALAILRNRAGKRTPPPIQRLQAQDLAALVFPDSIACPENLGGDREIPDHPLVNQTVDDCLYEAMDVEALEALLRDIAAGRLTLLEKDVREPSPLAEAVLSARPYAFLDDAPLEERRTRAVKVRTDWTPTRTDALARLDPMAVSKVRAQAAPSWRDADELHDALLTCGFLAEAEILHAETRPTESSTSRAPHLLTPGDFTDTEASPRLLANLAASGRAFALPAQGQRPVLWYAAERRHEIAAAFQNATEHVVEPSAATRELLRGRLEVSGPVTEAALCTLTDWPPSVLQVALLGLEAEGFAFRGEFPQALRLASEAPHDEMLLPAWCDRHLLARIHRLARDTVRRQADPVPVTVFQQGLFAWHRMFAQDRLEGPEGLAEALLKLEGCDAPLAAWEQSILPLRVAGYRSDWLDSLLLSGRFHWRRKVRRSENVDGSAARPSFHRGLPIAFYAAGNEPELPTIPETVLGHAALVIEHLRAHGAAFWRDIARVHRQPLETVREGLKEAVARGWVACDGLTGLRALLTTSAKRSVPGPEALDRAGRWYLISQNPTFDSSPDREGEAETWAKRLLLRYGFLFRRLAETESEAPPWRELLRALRRFEDRGEIRGGRFVTGFSGEQFALPDAAAALHSVARRQGATSHESMRFMTLSAHDPLNLQGLLTPGPRLTAQGRNRVLYDGGEPVAGIEAEEFKAIKASDADPLREWQARLLNPSPPEKTLVP